MEGWGVGRNEGLSPRGNHTGEGTGSAGSVHRAALCVCSAVCCVVSSGMQVVGPDCGGSDIVRGRRLDFIPKTLATMGVKSILVASKAKGRQT